MYRLLYTTYLYCKVINITYRYLFIIYLSIVNSILISWLFILHITFNLQSLDTLQYPNLTDHVRSFVIHIHIINVTEKLFKKL